MSRTRRPDWLASPLRPVQPFTHAFGHGASPTTLMTHIAIQEALNGKAVEWMERVTDEQYLAGLAKS